TAPPTAAPSNKAYQPPIGALGCYAIESFGSRRLRLIARPFGGLGNGFRWCPLARSMKGDDVATGLSLIVLVSLALAGCNARNGSDTTRSSVPHENADVAKLVHNL